MKKYFLLLLCVISLFPLKVKATSEIIIMDLDSGRVLFESNAHEKRLIASITKIMTAMVTIENVSLDKQIIIGDEVLKSYGTNTYISVGEKIKVKDLLYGLILRSGNDAALSLSYSIDNNPNTFIEKMNEKAEDIGMKDTIFENPHGLDEETKNYSTAYDMALLSKYAYQNKYYRNIAGTKKYTLKTNYKSYIWYNRNKLLSTYKYCNGGKNGYTPSAGKTLVSTATKDNLNLTIVSLNDPNIYETHESLYNYYFSKYKTYTIINKDTFKFDKTLINKDLYLKDSFSYPLTEKELKNISTKIKLDKKKENIVGQIEINLENKLIGKVDIYEKETKSKKEDLTIFKKIKNLIT